MNQLKIAAILCGLSLAFTAVPVESAMFDHHLSALPLPITSGLAIQPMSRLENLSVDIPRTRAPSPSNHDSYRQHLRLPLATAVPISSHFGNRVHPITGVLRPHTGTDFAAESGAPVLASLSGRVVYVGEYGGYGTVVAIQHNAALYTLYAHLSETYAQSGAWVEQSTPIAAVGSTGAATGPHLHFEVRILQAGAWYAVDPEGYL
jgi:murein DD-endopeptidase MepM/ murein hydrolase activator NlpD